MSITPLPAQTPLTERVAEEIRAMMARRRMTGRALARALQVSPMWVSYRLNGTQPIDLNDLEAIARALGVRAGDLMPSTERVEPPTYRKDFGAEQPTPIWVTPHRPTDTRPPGRPRKSGPNPATRRPVRISAPPPDLRAA